jgi:hypothetical protein
MRILVLFTFFVAPAAFSIASAQPAAIDVPNGPIPIQILEQSPANTSGDLQIICLFRSTPENKLHGSLAEINTKLKGLLDRIRKQDLFRGDLGEALLLAPPKGSLGAKQLLIIGLGDSKTFTPERMQLAGEIGYSEASRLSVRHAFFAPTILDGGVTAFSTGEVSEQVILGLLRAVATTKILTDADAAPGYRGFTLTYLAGPNHADSTRQGIEKALASSRRRSQ